MAAHTHTIATDPAMAATGEIPAAEMTEEHHARCETPVHLERPAGATANGHAVVAHPAAGEQARLQDILPEITELAQRVGGFKKLAEIIATLEMGKE